MLPDAAADPDWAPAAERALKTKWATHPLKAAITARCDKLKDHSQEVRLMQNTARLMGCLPSDIISAKNNMAVEYDHRPSAPEPLPLERSVPDYTGADNQAAKCLWSPQFCTALNKIIVHPSWNRDPRLLGLAIQYTIICATDDRRPWQPDCPPWQPFLGPFIEKTSKNNAGVSVSNIHRGVVKDLREQCGEDELGPWWSRLFTTLSNLTAEERRAVRLKGLSLKPQDAKPYVVRTSDLHHLAAALKIVDGETVTGNDSTAPNAELYAEALEAVWLDNLRQLEQKDRPAPNNFDEAMETSDLVIADSEPATPNASSPEPEQAPRRTSRGPVLGRTPTPSIPDIDLDIPMGGVDGAQPEREGSPDLGSFP
jgi:hypothetical protein